MWETKVLKRLKVINEDKWLNQWYGDSSHMFGGKIQSNLAKRRLKRGTHNFLSMNKLKIKCPYCDIQGQPGAMGRWHFENCKKRGT